MRQSPGIAPLAHGLHRLFHRSGHKAVARILENWPERDRADRAVPPRDLPVTAFLPEALGNAPEDTAPLVRDLVRRAPLLHWRQTYSEDDLGADFLRRYGWTELVGPAGYVDSDRLLSGFLFLGPGVEYPVHRHSAEEAYLVLSGAASWNIAGDGWQPRPAGTVVHNPPWQLHGMRTDRGQPLLIAYLWNAGVIEKSQIPG